jgi:hypothetical protein
VKDVSSYIVMDLVEDTEVSVDSGQPTPQVAPLLYKVATTIRKCVMLGKWESWAFEDLRLGYDTTVDSK